MSIALEVNTHLKENTKEFSEGLKKGLYKLTDHIAYVMTTYEYGSKHMLDELECMASLLSELQRQADALDISLHGAKKFEKALDRIKGDVYSLVRQKGISTGE